MTKQRKWKRKPLSQPVDLPQRVNAAGETVVDLEMEDGTVEERSVGELVLTSFRGPKPRGGVLHHLDGDPANNALSNLEWRSGS